MVHRTHPQATFPENVWDESSYNRPNADAFISPGPSDYARIRAEVVAVETYLKEMAYGEIYVKNSEVAIILSPITKIQITNFTNNGLFNNSTPDYTNNHILINNAGRYLATVSIAVRNSAGSEHSILISLYKNNGLEEFSNVHVHRSLTAGSAVDIGSLSLNGIVDLEVGDTIELWALTDNVSDRDVIFSDVTLSLTQLQ